MDLPGIYSLALGVNKSIEQKEAIRFLLSKKTQGIVNIINSTDIENNFYLTLELLELGIPLILVLNMYDLSIKKQTIISKILAVKLECPVLRLNATDLTTVYSLCKLLSEHRADIKTYNVSSLYLHSIQCIYNKMPLSNITIPVYDFCIKKFDLRLVNVKYHIINDVVKQVIRKISKQKSTTDIIDIVCLHRLLGLPLFLLVIYVLFLIIVKFGNVFGLATSIALEALLVDTPCLWIQQTFNSQYLISFVQAMGTSICAIASFIPVIWSIYLCLALLESSGYMVRAAIITSKFMSYLGLSSNSFFSIIVGIGCNVPAIMAARIINNQTQRVITTMIVPFLSCSARLSLYTLCCFIFFPHNSQLIIIFLYMIGFAVAMLTALVMHNKNSRIEDVLCIALPKYQFPKICNILFISLLRTKIFICGAGKTIIVVFFIVNFLNKVGLHQLNKNGIVEQEILFKNIGHFITPIFKPMGFEKESWPAAISIVTGFLAKEVVIATLLSLQSVHKATDDSLSSIRIQHKLQKSFSMIRTGNIQSITSEVDKTVDGQAKIFRNYGSMLAYLIFIALYVPCFSVVITMGREIGYYWALVSAIWTTANAYMIATICFQIFSFIHYDNCSFITLGIFIILYIFLVGILKCITGKYLYR